MPTSAVDHAFCANPNADRAVASFRRWLAWILQRSEVRALFDPSRIAVPRVATPIRRLPSTSRLVQQVCLILGSMIVAHIACAQRDGTPIQWVGPAFVGESASALKSTPYFSTLWKDEGFKAAFTLRLNETVRALQAGRNDLRFAIGKLMEQGDDTYMLTFVIAGENVEAQQVEENFSIAYEIQALVFVGNISKDQAKRRIVTSYPVRIRYIDVSGREPSFDQALPTFRKLYLTPTDGMPDIVHEWGTRAKSIKFREKNIWVQVPPLKFSDSALALLESSKSGAESIALRSTSLLEAGISRTLDIPVIPAASGEATNQMVLSLANLDARESFAVADPDYSLQVTVRELRHITEYNQTTAGSRQTGHLYGAALVVALQEVTPDGAKRVLSEVALRRVDFVIFTGERRLSAKQQFSRVLSTFHHELSSNFSSPDPAWILKSKSDSEKRTPAEISAVFSDFAKRLK